jgi:hypothetical protein
MAADGWPRTKYSWFGELGARGYPVLAIHQGKNLLVTLEVARLVDPIARAELERLERADPGWERLLRHLAEAGPSELEDLQLELGLKPKELKQLRSPLERCGAVVSRSVVYEEPHRHTSVLSRWDQVFPESAGVGGLADLVVAAVRAAVVAPVRELPRWFSWQWRWDDAILDDERLVHVDGHVTAAAIEALRSAGVGGKPVARGLAYLRNLQRKDGGFPLVRGRASDSQSTAWAIQAFVAAGKKPPAASFRFLARMRRPDGSYR